MCATDDVAAVPHPAGNWNAVDSIVALDAVFAAAILGIVVATVAVVCV